MKKAKTIYIVSLNGIKNAGGVERVTFYLNEILSEKFPVKIITKNKISFGKLNNLIYPVLLSMKLLFIPNKIVIANSWHCFLYKADFSIHHGTSAGILKKTGEGGLAAKLTAKMEKISAKNAKHILAVSENCKSELINLYGIDENKIDVLNNFVYEKKFIPSVNKIKNNKIKVIFSGALCNKKGLLKLMEFSEYIETKTNDFELLIASNYSNQSLWFQNKKNTKVFTNLTFEEMYEFYQKGDVLFFPTLYEGFSMSVLEALSCGLPVVGTNFAVSPEIQHYDFCKLIDKNEAIENIIAAIKNLYNSYNNKKDEIHMIITKDFGKEQYKNKLINYIYNYNN